ncbi:PEGA domain-containing protein [Methanoregula sp.]|jgi:hypothetical protein|uniref:PEGA domain-containing protein n=1 Tax=Methanoregula sp. TaxID=2052170 RepID=UPI003C15E608
MAIHLCPPTICAAVLCTALFLVMPGYAIQTAVYGSTAGLNLSLHPDEFTMACSLPGLAGPELDQNLSCFTNASTDVIILGGDAGFSGNSQASIGNTTEDGRILVLSGSDLERFADILPVQSGGTAPGSMALMVSSPNTTLSEDIFAGMPSDYPNTTSVTERESYTIRTGATTLLSFENGDPALVFSPYGNGYIVTWLPPSDQAYLSTSEADLINERLITHLLALRSGKAAATSPASTYATDITTTNTTIPPATTTMVPSQGNVSVSSSPPGANVFIDDVYEGITPVNLTGISSGSHVLRLQINGYGDFETSIQVSSGETTIAFGSLDIRNRTVTTPATVTMTPTDSSSVWTSPTVIAAVIGSIAAILGAIATIHSIYRKQP